MKKKLLLIIFLFIISIVNVYATNFYGDVDGNYKIGLNDYILVRKHILKSITLSGDSLKRADVNKDNKITAADYIAIRKMIITGASLVPIPTPTPKPTVAPTPKPTATPVPQYTVKYYGASTIETGLRSVDLSGTVDVPVIASSKLNLSVNTSYVVSFDYKAASGSNKFNIDLFPDTLPEIILTATTTNTHYDWVVSSNKSDMSSSQLRFFDNQKEASESDITITNIYMGTVRSDVKKKGETLGNLPSPTRSGYKFLGWYTSYTGGTKVSSSTTVNSNMVLYPRWEEEISAYVLPDQYAVPAGYSVETGKTYISDTLKYKTITNNNNRHYALIWVRDAYTQLNSANNNLKGGGRILILNQEISMMGYQSKGMIATNGSFTISGRSNTPVIVTKGTITNNENYSAHYQYGTLTLGSDGMLKMISTADVTNARNWVTSVGARNTWAITHFEQSNWNGGQDGGANYRTSLCQIDKNNFVLYTGYSLGIHDYMKELHDLFGCKTVINLDGGGSTGMYYKTKSMTQIGTVFQRKVDNRSIADMLYFVEK